MVDRAKGTYRLSIGLIAFLLFKGPLDPI